MKTCPHCGKPLHLKAPPKPEKFESPMTAFLRDRCEIDTGHVVWLKELYLAWKDWSQANGRDRIDCIQQLGRELRAAMPELSVHRSQRHGRWYQGIRLKI